MERDLSRFRRLALVTAVTTLVLTGIGGLVRATGSGLGCRDEWPRCDGGWVAPPTYHAIIEYSHRFVAAIVIVLIASLVVASLVWVREQRIFLKLSLACLVTVIGLAAIGAAVVFSGLHAEFVSLHFIVALALVGLTTLTAALTFTRGRPKVTGVQWRVHRASLGALVALLPVLILGVYVRDRGAGLAFVDWPLMNHTVLPSLRDPGAPIMFVHRLFALLATGHLVMLWLRTRKDPRANVRRLGNLAPSLYLGQALAGGANVLSQLKPAAIVTHEVLAFVVWSTYVVLATISRAARSTSTGVPAASSGTGVVDRITAYVRLTKPRIIVLLLITTVPAMVLAERGAPPLWLIGATLLGGMMTAGSANALNQFLERDIDEKMDRTRSRPLPSASVEPAKALVFAIVLGVAGFVWLTIVVNLLSAILAVAAIVFYVVVYTLLLKRNTPQNIVIGGAAGAVPVLIGWAAVTGTVGLAAWVMFAIVFFWTPPHFWALAMRYRDDYEAAGVPMMPVVRTERQTTRQIFLYAVVLVAVTLVLEPVGGLGLLYVLVAVLLGAGFVYRAARLRFEPTPQAAYKLFQYSITYLGVLFVAIAVDRLLL
jgi:protoheme IX farnesyltransferase